MRREDEKRNRSDRGLRDICSRCWKRPPRDDRSTCDECRSIESAAYERRVAKEGPTKRRCGLCRETGHLRQRCPLHKTLSKREIAERDAQTRRDWARDWIANRAAKGLSSRCRKRPPIKGLARCQTCRDDNTRYYDETKPQRTTGPKCRQCGRPGHNATTCARVPKPPTELPWETTTKAR